MWTLDSIELNGGFLPGLKLTLPHGLICIIGPRGSGKSTLAEALRFAIKGTVGASKPRLDLLQANVGASGLVTLVARTDAAGIYTIRRGYKQSAVLLSADGRAVPNVDLDRGTFLPLDAYNGPEIEAIADETLGERRRALLDDLRGEQLSTIHLSVGEHRRALEANADRIRATRRSIDDLSERIEEIGDARARLASVGPLPENAASTEYTAATRQQQCNARERKRMVDALAALSSLARDAEAIKQRASDPKQFTIVEETSANSALLLEKQAAVRQTLNLALAQFNSVIPGIESAKALIEQTKTALATIHARQAADLIQLQQVHREADERYRVRLDLEQNVQRLQEIEKEHSLKKNELVQLLSDRKTLKAKFLLEREQVSELRDEVASELQLETGRKVRIRVLRNADNLAYRTLLTEGLKGARVRNHEEILDSLLQLRPEQLAQFIQMDGMCLRVPNRGSDWPFCTKWALLKVESPLNWPPANIDDAEEAGSFHRAPSAHSACFIAALIASAWPRG
jgi:chromosome segregation protein